ncbi:EscC/YscC/HrcC family type III secretion system outer membrane ring protein [Pandoraea sputorum]|uniref:EscC/YscC/HrcC family type III secretion system outer membrane ring protein n=1 Tax=Pandoraea sputorum TaxID=93222 RepID=UPI00124299DC|nr:EscC/YscC/HrcC family type III secretion system outer membrane ring protein [Pandoraea sputorum]VVE55758.1 EscC/YscC/HrcC family type III secretion system outer membrane ring protein [Pandoraea sputorum]
MKCTPLIVASLICTSVCAEPIPWQGQPFFASSRDTPLASVLKNLGANYRLPVVVSAQVSESFAGTLQDTPRGSALAELSRLYQLMPYYDGNTLYVYKAEEMGQTLLTPAYLNGPDLTRLIEQSRLMDGAACRVQAVGGNALQISGVPICLSRVSALAKQLDEQNLNQEQNRETVMIFPLRYASAADSSYTYRTQTVVVPGVTTVLREMAQGRALPLPENKTAVPTDRSGLPTFSADARQNAVLVRDRKKNMSLYEELIPKLDQRPTLVEISVAIIDVNAGDVNKLGIDWSASASIGGGTVAFNSGGDLSSDSFSAVVSNAGNFMLQLNALQQTSKAKIISRPSVVTLDNVQAVLDRSITFYTKLVSEKNAQLEPITAGALMRVTPRIIHEPSGDRVLLTLNIQDGRQEKPLSLTEPLPQVQNAEIATQATLNIGQALLLGGFVQDENIEGERKIPLLSDIPLIGGLFRSSTKSERSVVRLFLIKAEPRQV